MCRKNIGPALLAALGLCWSAGCGGGRAYDGPERVPVRGAVSIDGEPVHGGTINFIPLDLLEGRTASALIQEGRYDIPEERGPIPGRYRVEISWDKPIGVDEENPDAPHESEQVIPANFNRDSELEREIESGENELDFELRSP